MFEYTTKHVAAPLLLRLGLAVIFIFHGLDMIQEDLVAERVAIESYGEIVRYLGNDDPTTRRMMESILAVEEEHAEDLRTLLQTLGQ